MAAPGGMCGRLRLLALLIARPCFAAGPARYPLYRRPVDGARHPLQTTFCVVDVAQAVFSMGEAAASINAAVVSCENTTTSKEKAVCSATLGNTVAAITYVAAYTAAALGDCLNSTNAFKVQTACAADIPGFLNGLATAWGAISSLSSGSCKDVAEAPFDVELSQGRRLSEASVPAEKLPEYNQYRFLRKSKSGPSYKEFIQQLHVKDIAMQSRVRDTEIAFCVFDVGQLVFYLTRAVAAIQSSVENCEPSRLIDRDGQLGCTVTIAGMLGAIIYTAFYISLAVSQCPFETNQAALCAADITALLTVFTSLISSAANFPLSCEKLGKNVSSTEEVISFPNRRRLGDLSDAIELFI